MKRCPECRRDYYDDSLLYCLDDGSELLDGPGSQAPIADEPATAILNDLGSKVGTRPLVSPSNEIAASHDDLGLARRSRPTAVRWMLPLAIVAAMIVAGAIY